MALQHTDFTLLDTYPVVRLPRIMGVPRFTFQRAAIQFSTLFTSLPTVLRGLYFLYILSSACYILYLFFCRGWCTHSHMYTRMCAGERKDCQSHFSPSTMWVLGSNFRLHSWQHAPFLLRNLAYPFLIPTMIVLELE